MYEVKADALEASFDAVEAGGAGVVRPVLAGGQDAGGDARRAFVDGYLRQGRQAGVEMKSFSGVSGVDGGFAVPREIDAAIDATLVVSIEMGFALYELWRDYQTGLLWSRWLGRSAGGVDLIYETRLVHLLDLPSLTDEPRGRLSCSWRRWHLPPVGGGRACSSAWPMPTRPG